MDPLFLPYCAIISPAYLAAQSASPMPATIFVAKKIITMDPTQPEATAVAIKDNRI